MGTLFVFGGIFRFIDSFLKFLLTDFLKELLASNEQEVIEVVENLPVGGIVHDLVAIVEQGVESFREQIANFGERRGFHKYDRVKMTIDENSLAKLQQMFDTPHVRACSGFA
jgi:cupin superfamily acireductone dioxygenase involved in methionine salvage